MSATGLEINGPAWLLLPLAVWLVDRLLAGKGAPRASHLPGAWAGLVAPALEPTMRLLVQPGSSGPARRLAFAATGFLALALADIRLGQVDRPDSRNLAGRVIVVDLGHEEPDTPAAAEIGKTRIAVASVLEHQRRAKGAPVPTALVAASGDAFDIVPLTTDYAQIERYLAVLDQEVMPVGGHAPARALAHAAAILERAGIALAEVLLVTAAGAPETQGTSLPRSLRRADAPSLVIVSTNEAERDGWQDFAQIMGARLVEAGSLEDEAARLDERIDRRLGSGRSLVREGADPGEPHGLELAPVFIALACLAWLGLFRREAV